MTMDEVIHKVVKSEETETYLTGEGTWVLQVFDGPYSWVEYEFTSDKQQLIGILEYDLFSKNTVTEKSIDDFEMINR